MKEIYKDFNQSPVSDSGLPPEQDRIVNILKAQGGKYWEKGGMKRVYFDADTIAKLAGYDWSTYNTGNISSATLDGEKTSNSVMRQVLGDLSVGKFWYDVETDKFIQKTSESATEWKVAVKKLRNMINAEPSEKQPKTDPKPEPAPKASSSPDRPVYDSIMKARLKSWIEKDEIPEKDRIILNWALGSDLKTVAEKLASGKEGWGVYFIDEFVLKYISSEHLSQNLMDMLHSARYDGRLTTKQAEWFLRELRATEASTEPSKPLQLPSPSAARIHSQRSKRSQAQDVLRTHSTVITESDPRIKRWIRDQGSMDVLGVDTPAAVTKPTRLPTPKPPKLKAPKLSARTPRITPRTPRIGPQHYSRRGGGLTRRTDI